MIFLSMFVFTHPLKSVGQCIHIYILLKKNMKKLTVKIVGIV